MKLFKGCQDGVHKFEARYDVQPLDLRIFASISGLTTARLEALQKRTYVRDVCVRCGAIIERESEVVRLARSA